MVSTPNAPGGLSERIEQEPEETCLYKREGRNRIFVDGTNPSFIRSLKERVDEDTDYEQRIAFFKRNYPSVYDLEFLTQNMFVVPVAFNKEHRKMLAHTKELLKYQNGHVAINLRFRKLVTALRTAVEYGEGMLD
jgi:hypothetical protein